MSRVKQVAFLIKHPKMIKRLMIMGLDGYLHETGWVDSFISGMPLDKDKKPIPWVTYSFIEFIKKRLNKDMSLFEFGSGNSTLFYAELVGNVISVEHDIKWYEKIRRILPENAKIYYKELGDKKEDYIEFVRKNNIEFDVIVVDGRNRVSCLKSSFLSISDDGVIVLDDSERDSYKDGIDFLLENGFKKIDFWGISPGLFYNKCTSVFYRKNNCLGI